ncbi:subtilase family protein [Primorskyibacter sedentarius]|uniref:Subtilase family protein n=1 Tax=Primorskyibacter sedentarius TaxID=745311 RepID=A0A4V2UPH1_9RHOB|nr:S8 family serine peptidase [Primorskyibacter sedentarius]TCS65881.1 subtilase family protein [Primorskyibacter sedentarius]
MVTKWTAPDTGDHIPIDALTFRRLASDFASFLDTAWWSAMIDLGDTSIAEFAASVAQRFPQDLLIPAAYDEADRNARKDGQFIAIFARKPLLEAMNHTGNEFGVRNVHLGMVTSEDWLDHDAAPGELPDIEVAPGTVVMGMIDDGLAIAHELFRASRETTRVEYCAVLPTPPDTSAGDATQGRILRKDEIDTYLHSLTFSDLLDEEAFYARTGQTDLAQGKFSPVSLRRSHGTHIMGIAAGFDPDIAETGRPIICTVLPPRVVEDTSGISLLPSLCLALQLLSKQASRFKCGGHPVPLVLNFSFGNFSGPHDGTSEVARLLEQFIADDPAQKRWMTLPSGNGNLARSHAVLQFDDADRQEISLDLRVLPDDKTASHVELWMPYSEQSLPPNYVSVTVTPPFGPESATVEARQGQIQMLHDSDGRVIATLLYTFEPLPTARGLITLAIEPTASLKPDTPLAPSGRWKITTRPKVIAPYEQIEVWIRRDETLPGYRPGGRQSFFDNACYERFGPLGRPLPVDPPDDPCPVRRAGMLSGFAGGASPMVVAGYTEQNHQLSDYSAAGPMTHTPMTPEPSRNGPDASALADESLVRWGVLSAGSRSGSYVRLDGTSVACPRVARLASDKITHWPSTARDWLAHAASEHPFELPPDTGETRTGAGGVDIQVDWRKNAAK